ncbi:glycoside hydrolase family 43 protein [Lewinella sp. IMCC34183]|uniref:glycoside hydrolase family 43 protein n=1 Tax=Lewinella sp. IMCC34183 TaxID=2248762 RepID=UPI000E251CB8|nr:glycoside hydrolase family 43 protein [Lewinella sp. IMCC34183]
MIRILFLTLVSLVWLGCQPAPDTVADTQGGEASHTFQNPILAGFYPDPAFTEANGKYYLTHSTFSYFPGLPIFESSDLVNWKQVGNAMHRREQMDTDGEPITRGLFAPGISYHDGLFYVICTRIDRGGNFIVTASDPAGPWSDPVYLPEVSGIDPSLFFDGDSTYVVYNSGPPNDESLYSGHRTIRMYALDRETLKVEGEQTLLVNGGVDISQEPVWIEAPHIYKIGEYYYLMCAEGGTAYNHSEVVFRSTEVRGPYEPWSENPILTQRTLDPSRPNPVTTAGHADMVQLPDSSWWAVFLAVRPYEGNYFNIGRETFLTPVSWTDDGWPVINPDYEEIQYRYPTPMNSRIDTSLFPLNGNFTFQDDFEDGALALHYLFMRTPAEQWYSLAGGKLTLEVRPEMATERTVPSFIGQRQQHHRGEISTLLEFDPSTPEEKAGLLAFQSETHHYLLAKSFAGGQPVVQLLRAGENGMEELASAPVEAGPLRLRISFDGGAYAFSYAPEGGDYQELIAGVDGKYLSTEDAGGFVGTVIGMYATSSGTASDKTASFDWLRYTGNDAVLDPRGT